MPSFRRCIHIESRAAGGDRIVRAVLEDDFHHFRVELVARGGRIASVAASAARHPYSLCPAAAEALLVLVGSPLPQHAHGITRLTEASEQCTHMLDLAGLACAAAVRDASRRRYEAEVPERVDGRTSPRLWRDGELALAWEVQDMTVKAPERYAGVELLHGMAKWALGTLPEDEAEAALVLRRCTVISRGRGMQLDQQIHARPSGLCYAQQPRRAVGALRQVGSTRDFDRRREALCADDSAWLAFAA